MRLVIAFVKYIGDMKSCILLTSDVLIDSRYENRKQKKRTAALTEFEPGSFGSQSIVIPFTLLQMVDRERGHYQ